MSSTVKAFKRTPSAALADKHKELSAKLKEVTDSLAAHKDMATKTVKAPAEVGAAIAHIGDLEKNVARAQRIQALEESMLPDITRLKQNYQNRLRIHATNPTEARRIAAEKARLELEHMNTRKNHLIAQINSKTPLEEREHLKAMQDAASKYRENIDKLRPKQPSIQERIVEQLERLDETRLINLENDLKSSNVRIRDKAMKELRKILGNRRR